MSVTTNAVWSQQQQAAIDAYRHRVLGVEESMLKGIPLSRHQVYSVRVATLDLDRAGVAAIHQGTTFVRFEQKLPPSHRVDHINLHEEISTLGSDWWHYSIGDFVPACRMYSAEAPWHPLNRISEDAYDVLAEYLVAHGYEDIRVPIHPAAG